MLPRASIAVLRAFTLITELVTMFGPFGFRLLPWDYGVRNLLRRPARSAMTLFGLTLVVLLVLVVVGFIRGDFPLANLKLDNRTYS